MRKVIVSLFAVMGLSILFAITALADTGYVNTEVLNIRSGPSTDNAVVGQLREGDVVDVAEVTNASWVKIRYGKEKYGYVASRYLNIRRDGQGSRSGVRTTSDSSDVVAYAKQYLGKPYRSGGNGPDSFDCSGFVKYVYSHFGVSLTRSTYTQVNEGQKIAKSDLKPGDLVFFSIGGSVSHVGIFIGNGEFIHATKPGDVVKITGLNSDYYANKFYAGRRVR